MKLDLYKGSFNYRLSKRQFIYYFDIFGGFPVKGVYNQQ